MFSLAAAFVLSLAAYAAGAFASVVSWRRPALARRICCSAALAGGVLGGLAAVLGILRGTPIRWSVSSGIPLFAYSFSYDSLAGFFKLAVVILVVVRFFFSFGYLKKIRGKRNLLRFGF